MGKSTISMVIFNSYVKLPEGKQCLDEFPEKNHHLGQRRGFEVAGNCSKLISTILVDEIRNIPLLLPLFNGRSKPCGCDSIPKIDPLHPLNPLEFPCVLQIINLSYFTDQFRPAGMISLQFFVPAISDSPSLQPWKRRATSEVGWLMSNQRRGEY